MSEILGTLGPCCNIIRRGECVPGTMHSGLCREQHGGELGPTIYLCDADSITALQARVAELDGQNKLLTEIANFGIRPDVHHRVLQRAERAESELAAARAECLRRQTIIGEVALERDAARALLREVNARTQGTIAEYEEYLTRIDAALAGEQREAK